MTDEVKKEIEKLIKEYDLDCSIKEFKNKVDWYYVSRCQKLSEKIIREFKNKVDWEYISCSQKLSEKIIREFKNKVDWEYISCFQKLSEKIIRKFKNKVDWYYISSDQILSKDFIREFQDKVDWINISSSQTLSEDFIEEFEDKINIKLYNEIHKTKTYKQKLREVKDYVKQYNLKFDDKFLYVYRKHDRLGKGIFNKTVSYEKGKYYKDWHCDMRENIQNSFGFGIWPKGNTPVKVKIEDWGVAVNREDGKARVWGFEMI